MDMSLRFQPRQPVEQNYFCLQQLDKATQQHETTVGLQKSAAGAHDQRSSKMNPADIEALSSLLEKSEKEHKLRTNQDSSIERAESKPTHVELQSPASIVKTTVSNSSDDLKRDSTYYSICWINIDCVHTGSKDIWLDEEVPTVEAALYESELDTRARPKYQFSLVTLITSFRYETVYRQKATATDVYFGISGNTPAIMSCDEILLRVSLPQTKQSEIVLEVTSTLVKVFSPK